MCDIRQPKMACLHTFQFSTKQTSVTYLFFLDFDQVCCRLHGSIRACISDTLAINVVVPFKLKSIYYNNEPVHVISNNVVF